MDKKLNSIPEHDVKGEQGTVTDNIHLDVVKMQTDGRIIVDPFGSWTGVPLDDPLETPIQDVDDL